MKHPAIISIDLGSAFTKISVRHGWNSSADLVRGLSIALAEEENYCIPSVVARVESPSGSRWLIGVEAAGQIPGKTAKVFRNWKAPLFRTRKPGAGDPEITHGEAVDVAIAFLGRLRKDLLEVLPPELKKAPVRVAVPSLVGAAGQEDLVWDILRRAGWEAASHRPTVFEPEANAIGLLSRGKNETWMPPQQDYKPKPGRSIRMQRMLEPGLSTAFRTMKDHYAVLVTDIGAFTTDFGFVKIDSSLQDDDWNRPATDQESVELGIRQLDDRVLSLLEPEVKRYFAQRPAVEWERRKRELYGGRPQKVLLGNQPLTIGADFELEAIQDEIQRFADLVCLARTDFCKSHGLDRIDEEAVTGGGSAVKSLRSSLIKSIKSENRRVHDLWDPREPDAATAAGAGKMTAGEKEQRVLVNRRLIRGGSAVGGASVFFE